MASTTSVISLFVLLFVTYCASVPLPTEYEYTTSTYEFPAGKPIGERASLPVESTEEYTTVYSKINQKRESVAKKDSSEDDELTTVYSKLNQKRESIVKKDSSEDDELTTVYSKLNQKREMVDKKESDELTTVYPSTHHKRGAVVKKDSSSEDDELTTFRPGHNERDISDEVITTAPVDDDDNNEKRAVDGDDLDEITTFRPDTPLCRGKRCSGHGNPVESDNNDDGQKKRAVDGEVTDEFTTFQPEVPPCRGKRCAGHGDPTKPETTDDEKKRAVDMNVADEITTQYSNIVAGHKKRNSFVPIEATSMFNERAVADEIDSEYTTQSLVERDVEPESFVTEESTTEFNNRVGQLNERDLVDLELTTVYESQSGEPVGQKSERQDDDDQDKPTDVKRQEDEYSGKGAREIIEAIKTEVEKPVTFFRKTETVLPGKVTKTELSSDGENKSYIYKETAVTNEVPSFSEGKDDSIIPTTNADN